MLPQLPGEAPALIREFLEERVRVVSLSLIVSVRRRALRIGAWWRVDPLRRGLLEAAVTYMRRGGTFKSPRALAMLREALIEALTLILMRSVRFMAYIVGSRLARALGGALGRVFRPWEVLVMGLQWLNTPPEFRMHLSDDANK